MKKIMVIEDDRELLDELKEMLSLQGYNVTAVNDSVMALEETRKIHPDLILLDMKMLGLDGFQVAEKLKQDQETSGIPIIAMTGYFRKNEHVSLMNMCGIEGCIYKPFSPDEISAKIESMLIGK